MLPYKNSNKSQPNIVINTTKHPDCSAMVGWGGKELKMVVHRKTEYNLFKFHAGSA